ncbi:hypothetical protein G6F24_018108 [Rhizopus arrhizus]|nr:hypothetical protein G6F24_018108 [Rhizopus arrhizus]
MARLAARFVVPIMADEAVNGPEDALDIARHGAADVLALKIAKSGGLLGGVDRVGARLCLPAAPVLGHRAIRPAAAEGRHRRQPAALCRF